MKTIANKETSIKKDENSNVKYSDLAIACLNQIPQGGLNATEMRSRIKCIDALENAGEEIQLEDAEFETLKRCVNSMKWAILHKDVVDFIDEINK
jgi:hypothetical protein